MPSTPAGCCHQSAGRLLLPVFSPDGRELWVAHSKGIKVLKLTRQASKLVLVPDREVPAPEVGPSNRFVAHSGRHRHVRQDGDVRDGAAIYEWRAESTEWWRWIKADPAVRDRIMFTRSRDGRWIVCIPSAPRFLKPVSHPRDGSWKGFGGALGRVSFSPDSRRLVFMDTNHHWMSMTRPTGTTSHRPGSRTMQSGQMTWRLRRGRLESRRLMVRRGG